MTQQQILSYFERVGLDAELIGAARDYKLLCAVQYASVMAIPYENLDIINGIPLKLDEESLFEKIVTRHRGGYCFELNGILIHLLRSLGFEVKDYFARYICGVSGTPMRRHRVAAVSVGDKRYLCDIGSRHNAPLHPLLIENDTEQIVPGGKFRITEDAFYGHLVQEWHEGKWRDMFGFTEEEQLDIDYEMPSFWCEKHPDSPFTKQVIVGIKTPTGRISLTGNSHVVFDGDNVIEKTVDDTGLKSVLKSDFGIIL